MIVLAAAESGCDVLWTEDLSDGQLLRGVRIATPLPENCESAEMVERACCDGMAQLY